MVVSLQVKVDLVCFPPVDGTMSGLGSDGKLVCEMYDIADPLCHEAYGAG